MNCPTDGNVLQLAERQGIEIDYCPSCRGVWLDRGELDKIIDRADPAPVPSFDARRSSRDRDDDDRGQRHGGDGRKRKRGGVLGELFDM